MDEEERSQRLAPGELVILRCLEEAEEYRLSYSSIMTESANHTESGKQLGTTILSKYLKNLQKSGLITRDIDSRKYILATRSWEMLYIADILSFLQYRFNRATSQGLKKAGIGGHQLEMFFFDDPTILQILESFLFREESLDTRVAMSKVLNLVDNLWKRYSLEAFDVEQREVIEEYKNKLADSVWILHGPSEEEWQTTRERIRIEVEKDLNTRYPGISTLEELFEMKAERRLKTIKKRRQNIPVDVRELNELFEALASKDEIPDVTARKLWSLLDYLEDPENSGIYRKYLEKIRSCPKAVIIFPSSGFKGYLKKYWKIFPEERESFKKSHPWLYNKITKK